LTASTPEDEDATQSFVVRIWPDDIQHGQPAWRGHIIHVRGHEDRYFDKLEAIPQFIRPFLVRMGLRVRPPRPLERWLTFLHIPGRWD
jgi:hypothetical protein